MRKTCRIEVELHIILLSPVHPCLEITCIYLITVYEFIFEITISLVQIKTKSTREQTLYLLDILTDLVNIASTAWIVTCRLNTTRQSFITFKAHHVISLPAMQGYRGLL